MDLQFIWLRVKQLLLLMLIRQLTLVPQLLQVVPPLVVLEQVLLELDLVLEELVLIHSLEWVEWEVWAVPVPDKIHSLLCKVWVEWVVWVEWEVWVVPVACQT